MKYVTVELSEELARALLKDVEQVKPLSPEQCRAVAAELHNANANARIAALEAQVAEMQPALDAMRAIEHSALIGAGVEIYYLPSEESPGDVFVVGAKGWAQEPAIGSGETLVDAVIGTLGGAK